MTEQTPPIEQTGDAEQTPDAGRSRGGWLRYVPPVCALGTAFVLQVIVVTDTVGGGLAEQFNNRWLYALGALLGVSVASCAEGGAAYLLDLYDKHLLAGDSVWLLRLAMVVYVAGSGVVIHWWTAHRHLPEVMTWLLAGMSASALFLWSRGSRWRQRAAMRARGQIDPAMPRLPVAARLFHPVRWLVTLSLVSWEPAQTPAEARARYEQWRSLPHWWRRTPKATGRQTPPTRASRQTLDVALERQAPPPEPAADVRSITSARPRTNGNGRNAAAKVSDDEAANIARLQRSFPAWRTDLPSVRDITKVIGGSLYTGQKYQRLLTAARTPSSPNGARSEPDDQERVPSLTTATA